MNSPPSLFVCIISLIIGLTSIKRTDAEHSSPKADVDWDSFSFGLNGVKTDFMWLNTIQAVDNDGSDFSSYSLDSQSCLTEMKNLSLSPTATVFNYGQALFEGLKAFRRLDGTIAMFRPENNALRMQQGAQRFLLPPVSTEVFCRAADAVVRANARWVPPFGKGALYLRPLLMGTGEDLGVKPSRESTFVIYCSPVGNYFKGAMKPIRLEAVRGFCRAAKGGAGNVKASGNYAPAFLVQKQVRARGYDEVLCLDAATGKAVEEAGASNFFVVYPNSTLVTPSLMSGTILPGVTRASIIELAQKECHCQVIEKERLTLEELQGASEAFCCGTGASVTPVGSIHVSKSGKGDEETKIIFGDGQTPGPITKQLYQLLSDLQTGKDEALQKKYKDWIHIVNP